MALKLEIKAKSKTPFGMMENTQVTPTPQPKKKKQENSPRTNQKPKKAKGVLMFSVDEVLQDLEAMQGKGKPKPALILAIQALKEYKDKESLTAKDIITAQNYAMSLDGLA